MKVSQNLYAETLLKALGAARGGLGTAEGGRRAVRTTLDAWSIPRRRVRDVRRLRAVALQLRDGGDCSTTVLERMYRDPRHRDAFVATLPIAGKDGTLATRMKRTRAEGNAVAKTGSISNVALAVGVRDEAATARCSCSRSSPTTSSFPRRP